MFKYSLLTQIPLEQAADAVSIGCVLAIDIFLELFPPLSLVSDFMYFKMPLVHSTDFSSIDNVHSLPIQTRGYLG